MEHNARTPPFLAPDNMAKKIGLSKKKIMAKVDAMKKRRQDYLIRWKSIRDNQLPFIGEFEDTADSTNKARRRDKNIYHGVAWESNQAFAAGVMSGLTPPSRPWFKLNFANKEIADETAAKRLLDQRGEILQDIFAKSNFYNAVHSCYLELAFGQAPLGIFQNPKTGVHFVPYTIGTYMLEAGADGNINTFCYSFEMNLSQLVEKFSLENLPYNLQASYKDGNTISNTYKVYWLVQPNDQQDKNKLGRLNMPYLSLYWLEAAEDSKEWLYVGGFYEFPVPVARYLVNGNDTYGKGAGWFAEGDAKGLQILEKDDIAAVELGVKPPMKSTSGAAMKGINLVPGSNTVVEQNDRVEPMFNVNVNLQHLQLKIQELEQRIKRAYNADLFRLLADMDNGKMTAREVVERTQEKMQQLGPVVERMQFEFLSPIIERVYNILDRAGIFPPPEDEELQQVLQTQEVKIEYVSPMAQAQKMSGLANIEQAISFMGVLAQFDNKILDKVNFEKTLDRYFDTVGAPAMILRSEKEFAEIQQMRQQQAMEAQQKQEALAMAQAAAPMAQAAKNATEAANDGNPALAALMGMGGGNA